MFGPRRGSCNLMSLNSIDVWSKKWLVQFNEFEQYWCMVQEVARTILLSLNSINLWSKKWLVQVNEFEEYWCMVQEVARTILWVWTVLMYGPRSGSYNLMSLNSIDVCSRSGSNNLMSLNSLDVRSNKWLVQFNEIEQYWCMVQEVDRTI